MNVFVLLFLTCFVACEGRKSYRGYQLLEIRAKNKEQVDVLKQIDLENENGEAEYMVFDGYTVVSRGVKCLAQGHTVVQFFSGPYLNHETNMLVSPRMLGKIKRTLAQHQLETRILNSDVQNQIDAEIKSLQEFNRSPLTRQSIYTNYLTYSQIVQWYQDMAALYPNNVRYMTFPGQTYNGNDIPWVKVFNDDGTTKPAMIVECLTHAREWITGSICMGLVDKMLQNYGDLSTADGEFATTMLDSYDWYLAPVHNPDGYIYSHTNDRFWRKNRVQHSTFCYGTDLNRNWDVDHGGAGTSTNRCADTYPGSSAFSEVETEMLQAEATMLMERQPIAGFFSFHCYSQLLLLPYAYTSTPPADIDILKSFGQMAMDELFKVEEKTFRVEPPHQSLYLASGGAYDWFKTVLNVKFSYTYEMRPTGSTLNEFILPESEIPNSIQEAFVSMGVFAREIKAWSNTKN